MEAEYGKRKDNVNLSDAKKIEPKTQKKYFTRAFVGIVVVVVLVSLITGTVIVITKKPQDGTSVGNGEGDNIDDNRHITLLISLDDFRPDYFNRGVTPNLNRIAKKGFKADFMYSSFPTQTFPNHYSIVTGLYPESHGIVSNNFYDSELGDSFWISGKKAKESKWWGGEPIWATAEKQNVKTASYFWVGSEAPIKGIQPTYWKKYRSSRSWSTRIQTVIDWMLLPTNERPQFITLYFEEPDKAAHKYGPNVANTTNMIKKVDESIGELLEKLEYNNLTQKVNMIFVSDHGMTDISCERLTYAGEITNLTGVTYKGLGALSMLYFGQDMGLKEKAFDDLKYSSKRLNVYSKSDITIPRRLHFTNNRRIGDIILSSELQWSVLMKKSKSCYPKLGAHGYDNIEDDMKAVFFGMGPDLKGNYSFDQLHNVEIYNLLTDLLHVNPAPNNGTRGSLFHLLKEEFRTSNETTPLTNEGPLYNFTQRYFPENYEAAYNACAKCLCPYCDRKVFLNRHYHMKTLNLTKKDVEDSQKKHFPWGLPMSTEPTTDLLLTQDNYVHGYSTQLHLPLWAGYELTTEQLELNINRSNCFRRDIRLTYNESAHCDWYYKSGYDRGHVANSGDFNFNVESEQDTFMLSNMVPQSKYFNRYGSWRYTEDMTRKLLDKYNKIHVISGTIFDANNDGIKDAVDEEKNWLKNITGSVAIPTHFYKILTRCNDAAQHNISACTDFRIAVYILPHTDNEKSKFKKISKIDYIQKHIGTVVDVERLTGLKFFTSLPLSVQARLKTKMTKEL